MGQLFFGVSNGSLSSSISLNFRSYSTFPLSCCVNCYTPHCWLAFVLSLSLSERGVPVVSELPVSLSVSSAQKALGWLSKCRHTWAALTGKTVSHLCFYYKLTRDSDHSSKLTTSQILFFFSLPGYTWFLIKWETKPRLLLYKVMNYLLCLSFVLPRHKLYFSGTCRRVEERCSS